VHVLVVSGTLTGPDDALATRVEQLLAGRCHDVVVDVSRVVRADVATVAALARLQVWLRGQGASMRLRGASRELRAVLELLGLDRALPLDQDI
jgi:ABC-type transporter Mla MlaB component